MATTLVEVTLVRPGPGSWGLRLQGGVDVQKALSIMNVTEASPSEQCGLKAGDVLFQINGQPTGTMTHKQAQDAIVSSGDRVALVVQRWAPQEGQNAPGVWKPNVEQVGGPATCPAPLGQTYTKTSLVAQPPLEDPHWDVKHNITAKAFNPGEPSPGFRSVSAPVSKPGGGAQPPGPPQLQVCWVCTKPIIGVFLQVKGRPTHADCFVCHTCKTSLKNVGHITVGDSMFCQSCAMAAQVQAQPQAGSGGPPQGLAANIARLAMKPQEGGNAPTGPPEGPCRYPPPGGPPRGPPQPSNEWDQKLNLDSAGMASNAEDFTKEFMKQLAGEQ